MRRYILFTLFVLFFISIYKDVYNQTASLKEIKDVAKNFYWEQSEISSVKVNYNTISPDIAFIESKNNNTIYYVVNLPNYNVHVYVSSDKRIKAVLGLGDGLYNTDDSMPPSYISWMEHYTEEIDYFLTDIKNGASYTKIQEDWTKYKTKNPPSRSKSVSPLLTTTWSQECYYNEDCPDDTDGPCDHALVGCVATAMAQIMKYHNHPPMGKGVHSYTHPTYGSLHANFGVTTYDWDAMPDEYGVYSANPAVAKLSYHCGVSVNMEYGPNISGAYSSKVDDAFEDYFKYHDGIFYAQKKNYSNSGWEQLLRNNLDNALPVYYSGANSEAEEGHAFVCDGYTGTNYFHFNWGWGGSYNGNFYVNNLTLAGYNFNYYQAAVVTIVPYKITVYSPNGGNNLKVGYSHTIRWFASGSENVKIELVNGWDDYTITSSTVNDGSYNWTVPSNFAIGDDYKIRISSTTNSYIYDFSNNNFTISEPYINSIFPEAGAHYVRGYTHSIYCATNLGGEYVKIELYKNGSYYSTITSSYPLTGAYHDWQIPSNFPIGDDYKIKITSLSNSSVYGFSDDNFSISEPYINLTFPRAGGSIARGHTHFVTWNTNLYYINENVKIELYKNDSYYSTITSSCQASDGTYDDWQIPSNQPLGDDYKIKITSLSNGTVYDISDGNFSISEPYIDLIRPVAGGSWARGHTHSIVWFTNISCLEENVKVELYKNDSYYSTLTSSSQACTNPYQSNGSYVWQIPSNHQIGDDYKIKIILLSDGSVYDFIDDNFTISEPYINVVSPNGGEYVAPGTLYQIIWDDDFSTVEDIKIELYKNDSFYSTITNLTDNFGYYSWEVDTNHLLGNDYKIKITSLTNPNISDFSNNSFSIDVPITLTSPIGGEIWQKGEPYTITWTDNISEDVVIELHKNGFYYSTISDSTPSDGNYIWNIPDNQLMSETYKVVIRSINTLTGSSISNNYFTISDITIHSPDGGEYLGQGTSTYITWAGHYVSENVKIDLYKTDNLYSTIITSTPNDCSYNWNIPDSITTGTDYKIKISSTTDTSFYDFSNNYFTIDSGYCENIQIIEGCGLNFEQWVGWYCCDGGYWYNSSNNACGVTNPGAEHIFSFVAPYTGTYSITVNLYPGGEDINPVSFLWKSSTCSTSEGWNCINEVWGDYNIYGSMYWTAGTTYYILLDGYGETEDFDETAFYINSPFPLTVTSPNEYEELSQGTSHNITWEDNISENVKIELIKYGYNSIITASTPSNGSYIWDIPNDQIPGDFYKIKISSINSSAIYDNSNRGFTIVTGVPANNIIQDIAITNGQAECYNATSIITVAGAGTTVDINSGGEAIFIAGEKVSFEPGFSAHSGSYVQAYITTSGEYCNQQQSMMANNINILETGAKAITTKDLFDNNEQLHINIYPNPTTGNFTIDFMGAETTAEIMVLNFLGNKVLQTQCTNQIKADFDISNLPHGMYVVVIKTQLQVITKRIVKIVN